MEICRGQAETDWTTERLKAALWQNAGLNFWTPLSKGGLNFVSIIPIRLGFFGFFSSMRTEIFRPERYKKLKPDR